MSEQTRKLAYIPVNKVRENPAALRKVDRSNEKYMELVDSVRNVGVLKPILVHETKDKDTGETVYGLSDGLHRYTAAQDAGLVEIPAHIVSLEESQILITQIMANAHVIETKPAEYSTALVRVLALEPTLTMKELAAKLNKSPTWLDARLSLVKLKEDIKGLVDDNKINLVNAYALAKLPEDEQMNFLDRALTEKPDVFTPSVNARVKEIRDAKRKGRDANPETFVPAPHLRRPGDLKIELENKTAAQSFKQQGLILDVESFEMGIKYALHLDPQSIREAEGLWNKKKLDREQSRKDKEIERNKKKEIEAKETLAKLGIG